MAGTVQASTSAAITAGKVWAGTVLATEMLANILKGYGHFFMISRGRNIPTTASIHRLMFEPGVLAVDHGPTFFVRS